MLENTSPLHHTALVLGIGLLLLSAGCSSIFTDGAGEPATAQQQTSTPGGDNETINNRIPTDGADLRSIAIPETEDNVTAADGEVDGGDPVLNGTNRYYEPISFTAEAGTIINVSMSSDDGNPELRLRDSNGTTIVADGGDRNLAQFEMFELNQSGQYTLVATSASDNGSFEYTLTVERYVEPNFNGPPSSWDEESRYLEFARDYILVSQSVSGGCLHRT